MVKKMSLVALAVCVGLSSAFAGDAIIAKAEVLHFIHEMPGKTVLDINGIPDPNLSTKSEDKSGTGFSASIESLKIDDELTRVSGGMLNRFKAEALVAGDVRSLEFMTFKALPIASQTSVSIGGGFKILDVDSVDEAVMPMAKIEGSLPFLLDQTALIYSASYAFGTGGKVDSDMDAKIGIQYAIAGNAAVELTGGIRKTETSAGDIDSKIYGVGMRWAW